MTTRTHRTILLCALTLASPVGCMNQRPAINRVQPDYLDKVDFIPFQYAALTTPNPNGSDPQPQEITAQTIAKEPIFYTQSTLISKPTTTGFTGLTRYSESDKIRWDVEEHYLIGRQAYSFIKDAPQGAGGIGDNVQTGDPVAIFKITAHFDIRHAYNTTTGEELNVLEENSIDRPWYQRRYMRIDWSANLIDSYNTVLADAYWDGRVNSVPSPVFVNSPTDPNAPVFEWTGTDKDRKLVYFDVVNKAILHPETTYLSYSDRPGSTTVYSKLPLCYLNRFESAMDCAPSEVTFRVAFRRAEADRDYEPMPVNLPIPDNTLQHSNQFQYLDMERFGFFEQARVGYDTRLHAIDDTTRMHFASRHNLWLHHHVPSLGANTGKLCNADADCASDHLCRIGNKPVDSNHRGQCAPLVPAHDPGFDIGCSTDDDCVQTITGTGQSKTAFCDRSTATCAEHYIRCGKDADCKPIDPNSTCDLAIAYTRADNRGMCLLPYLQRQVRQIAYHESTGYPDYMQSVTESVVSEWNSAFVNAVTSARRRECEINSEFDPSATDGGSNPCNDEAIMGLDSKLGADAKFIYVGCHSPVWGTGAGLGQHSQADVEAAHAKGWDLAVCGPQGTDARIGDLRYSMIGAITDHDSQGYWGLANIASDPETGEMVVGRGAVWQTITDTQASYLVTLVQLLNGDLDPESVSNGDYVVDGMKQFGTGKTPASEVLDAPLREANSLARISTMRTGIPNLILPGNGYFKPGSGLTLFSNDNRNPGVFLKSQEQLMAGRILGDGTAAGAQRLLSLAGTPLEGRLMNSQQALLADTSSPDPTASLPQTLDQASPMRMQSVAMRRVIDSYRNKLSAFECEYEAGFGDDVLLGLAQRLAGGARISASDPKDADVAFGRDWDFSGKNWALMQEYAANFIHHGVLAHELGHSVGMRHNFTASADAVNYFDNYWLVRGKGHPVKNTDPLPGLRPRYDYLADPADGKYYSDQEIEGRIEEYSYSSVMDYKGLNEDAHGLGRYDYAFVKNGYVGLVEAFKNVVDAPKATYYAVNTAGTGLSTPLDLTDWQTTGAIHGMHYTQIPTIFGTKMGADGETLVPNIGSDNRYNVFLRETCGLGDSPACGAISGWGPPAFSNVTADGHHLVPYRFDSDNRAGLVWQVQRYDTGADAYESLHYLSERMLNYYFINSFARLRAGFSTVGYVNRIWARYLGALHQCSQLLAFDLINFQNFFGTGAAYQKYKNDPSEHGGFVNQAAMGMMADVLTGLLTMPEMGYHNTTAQFDKSLVVQPINGGQYLTQIPVNEGRTFESRWRQDVGFFWVDMLNSAGSYYDKVMAIQSLTDPDLLLLQRDTPTDIRQFELSFYTIFPDQMIRLFGGLVSEDYSDFAPIVDLNKTTRTDISLTRTHVPTLNLPQGTGPNQSGRVIDAHHVAIDPQDQFTIQLWAIVHSMAQFPATYDQRYVDYARVWVDGSVESIQVANQDVNTVWFTDPWSHVTYRALHFGTQPGEGGATVGASASPHLATGQPANEAGVGARAILHLKDLDVARLAAIAKNDNDNIALLTQQEQQYIDVIHAMRDVTQVYGHGYSSEP